jgi:spermidine synthase
VFDDGRRWLNRHPDEKFDFILMNTTYHWRSMLTNLVSADFLQLCKAHLKPGGVIYYNTTEAEDVAYTTAQMFQHVVRYNNFVAGSDSPFDMTVDERRANLLRYVRNGKPVLDVSREDQRDVLEGMASADLSDQGEILRSAPGLWLITDDNMASEFKHMTPRRP